MQYGFCVKFCHGYLLHTFSILIPKDGIEREVREVFEQSLYNTALVLLLPYSISWLYLSWREKSQLLENIEQENIQNKASKTLIAFQDEKGDLKISVMLENLLYIESADNYATIYYINKSSKSHYMIRNSLKCMEENLAMDTPLVRCHRSYIVNLDKVKILKKEKNGIMLELDAESTPDIPVSKTYYLSFMDKFSMYSVYLLSSTLCTRLSPFIQDTEPSFTGKLACPSSSIKISILNMTPVYHTC